MSGAVAGAGAGPCTPTRESDVVPANGSILLINVYSSADTAHDSGTIITKGQGVPWLSAGERVAFKRGAGTTFTIDARRTMLPLKMYEIHVSHGPEGNDEKTWVTLLDQRDVAAVLRGDVFASYAPSGTPEIAL